jgi:NAD(P)-dependent dehydrogenase (short-subunit alcohol dehydrogenase family)
MNKQELADLFDVTGKVAIVTGASGSFGSVASKALAAAGAKVVLTGRNEAKLAELTKGIVAEGGEAVYLVGDPVVHDDVTRVVKGTVEEYGGIDILVTAAGLNAHAPITEQPDEDWQMVMDANVKGTWLFCKEVGKVMIDQGRGGKVVLVGSVRGEVGLGNYTAYCPSKGAIHLMTKSLALEWGKHKINVNCIAPATFRSEITRFVFENEEFNKKVTPFFAIGRLGEPEDLVGTLLLLSSRASDWMTGSVVLVDGGFLSGH